MSAHRQESIGGACSHALIQKAQSCALVMTYSPQAACAENLPTISSQVDKLPIVLTESVCILLYERRAREKLRMIIRGVRDARRDRRGPFRAGG